LPLRIEINMTIMKTIGANNMAYPKTFGKIQNKIVSISIQITFNIPFSYCVIMASTFDGNITNIFELYKEKSK